MKIFISSEASLHAKEDGLWLHFKVGVKHAWFNLSALVVGPIATEVTKQVLDIVRESTVQEEYRDTRYREMLAQSQYRDRLKMALWHYATPGQNGDVARKALGLL